MQPVAYGYKDTCMVLCPTLAYLIKVCFSFSVEMSHHIQPSLPASEPALYLCLFIYPLQVTFVVLLWCKAQITFGFCVILCVTLVLFIFIYFFKPLPD